MRFFTTLALLLYSGICSAQNERVKDQNFIFWKQVFGKVQIAQDWSLLAEAQFRRADQLSPQQYLFRGAVQYNIHPNVALALGYGYIETPVYGDFPIAANGSFPEHRVFQQTLIKQELSSTVFTHRFRIEQRWLGRRTADEERNIDGYNFTHRFRYLFRFQQELARSNRLYAALANEVFIGAGKNTGQNIFDQNRFQLIIGTSFNKNISIELGYLNQTLMQGRRISDKVIMQHNNGLSLATIINL